MTRYLFVFSWSNPALIESAQARLTGLEHVEVVHDRRFRERRRRDDHASNERRERDRRQLHADESLETLGWILVRRD